MSSSTHRFVDAGLRDLREAVELGENLPGALVRIRDRIARAYLNERMLEAQREMLSTDPGRAADFADTAPIDSVLQSVPFVPPEETSAAATGWRGVAVAAGAFGVAAVAGVPPLLASSLGMPVAGGYVLVLVGAVSVGAAVHVTMRTNPSSSDERYLAAASELLSRDLDRLGVAFARHLDQFHSDR